MSERDLREGLLTAVATEPPLGLDIDDLVDRARRDLRRRRALLATAMATAVLAAGVVVIPAMSRAAQTTQAAGRMEAEETIVSVRPDRGYTEEELRQRSTALGAATEAKVRALVPAATVVASVELAPSHSMGRLRMDRVTTFDLDGTRYAIMVTAMAPGTFARTSTQVCDANGTHCLITNYQSTSAIDGMERPFWIDDVRPDDTVITAAWLEPRDLEGGPSEDVIKGYLTAIANDPAVRF